MLKQDSNHPLSIESVHKMSGVFSVDPPSADKQGSTAAILSCYFQSI